MANGSYLHLMMIKESAHILTQSFTQSRDMAKVKMHMIYSKDYDNFILAPK